MKKIKKILLLSVCAFILCSATACGSEDDADNGADQTETDKNVNKEDDIMNDATGGNGVLDDAVHDVTDGVDDVTDDITDDVDKAADDLTQEDGPQKDMDGSDKSDRDENNGNTEKNNSER